MAWIWFAAGCVAGGLLLWAFARGQANAGNVLAEERRNELERVRAELAGKELKIGEVSGELEKARLEAATAKTRIEVVEAATAEKIATLTDVENSLKASFPSLAAAALNANNAAFITLAKNELGAQQGQAKQDLEAKHTAIKNLLQPVQTTLEKLEAGTAAIELKRENAYASMLAEVGNIRKAHELLRGETTQLVSALRDSGTRGAWGALQLKRCLEFAGMTQYCSFDLEKFVRLDSGESQRPDCVLYLPNKRTVIVDAKTPMEAFLEAIDPSLDADQRRTQLMRHARQVRLHLDALETKAYWKQFPDSPDFVICFLPKEALFSAALEADPTLIEYGSGRVILSTPTTLIALLKAIAYGWQQVEMARDAEVIKGTAISLYDKVTCLYDAFSTIGKRLTSTAKAWEDARVQMEGRGGVFPLGRKLRRYGIGTADLKDTNELQLEMHPLQADDWKPEQQLSLAAAEEDVSVSVDESV